MEEAAATSRARKNLNTATSARQSKADPSGFAPDSIQARLLHLRRSLPKRAWSTVPRDGSVELDHYLYGAPKSK
jgi:hypothetical protein